MQHCSALWQYIDGHRDVTFKLSSTSCCSDNRAPLKTSAGGGPCKISPLFLVDTKIIKQRSDEGLGCPASGHVESHPVLVNHGSKEHMYTHIYTPCMGELTSNIGWLHIQCVLNANTLPHPSDANPNRYTLSQPQCDVRLG